MSNYFTRVIKSIFCRHRLEWVRNIHGDEVIQRGWMRSMWQCEKCGMYVAKKKMHFGGKGSDTSDNGTE